jgi:glycosyltransferase involved in cell wall biosynthesis
MGQYLNAMDVLVLPSLSTPHWKEQFGRVLVEAMGCKVAVVGSNSGAIPEVIGDARRIFPEGSAPALAVILQRLAENPVALGEARESGYRNATEVYSVQRIASKTLDIWHRLVGR